MHERSMEEMVRNQRPLAMGPEASVQDACKAMFDRRVGAVLVVDPEQRLLGIFTGRDVVRLLAEGREAAATPLSEVVTRNPACLGPDGGAQEALRLFSDGGFRHLPVVRDGRVEGIVSRYDFRAMEHARMSDEQEMFETLR